MELLYIGHSQFYFDGKKVFSYASSGDSFFGNFLDVFSSIKVLGEKCSEYVDKNNLVQLTDPRINVIVAPPNARPKELLNDSKLRKILYKEIEKAKAIIIKPATRRGIMAIKICEQMNKKYMIYMTGDVYEQLRTKKSILKRLYAPLLYRSVRRSIENCEYGLYISKLYLQKKYPIKGKTCACPDVIIKNIDRNNLVKRICRIHKFDPNAEVNLALIGFYHSNAKGIDTAIEALSSLPINVQLNILGYGTEENREKWIAYGEAKGVVDRINFPMPKDSSDDVLRWLDTQDIFILPSRSEGFGRCIAEAMSRACPCICTDTSTIPELIPSNWLHPVGDDRALAQLIQLMLNSKDIMQKAAEINFEESKQYEYMLLKERRNGFLKEFLEDCSLEL